MAQLMLCGLQTGNPEKRTHMNKTIFEISKMDCPSEENIIRIKLDGMPGIKNLTFDIANRKLTVGK